MSEEKKTHPEHKYSVTFVSKVGTSSWKKSIHIKSTVQECTVDVSNCYRWMSNIGNRKGSDFAFRVGEDLEVGDQQQIYGNLGGVRGE